MCATTYEDLPHETRAMIWKYRTVLRKQAATIMFRNIAKFVIAKRACRFCLELFSRELVALTEYYIDEEGNDWDEGRVAVYQCEPFVEANRLFGMHSSMARKWMEFHFSVEEFVLSPYFTKFAAACNVSFSTDTRNLKIQFEKAIPDLDSGYGFDITNLALDRLRNLPGSEPESELESASESDSESGSEFESEEAADRD